MFFFHIEIILRKMKTINSFFLVQKKKELGVLLVERN